MPEKLITIAQYLEPFEAEIIRNRLEEEGIRSVLDNLGMVSMAWHFSQAVGGVKLLVFEEDADRARELLAEMRAELEEAKRESAAQRDQRSGQPAETKEVFAEQDEEIAGEDSQLPSAEEDSPWRAPRGLESSLLSEDDETSDEDPDEYPATNQREQLAEKTLTATIIGYLFCPLQFYATYLILMVLFDPRPLDPKVNRKLNWAIGLNGFYWFGCCVLWWRIVNH